MRPPLSLAPLRAPGRPSLRILLACSLCACLLTGMLPGLPPGSLGAGAGPARAASPPQLWPPQPGEVPESPHPWRVWEAERKAAALQRAAAAGPKAADPLQDRYDVHFYDLDLDLRDTQGQVLVGSVTAEAVVVGGGDLAEFVLDLADELTVDGVSVGGAAAAWTHGGDRLRVTLPEPAAPGENLVVTVDYHGNPEDAGNAFGWDSVGGYPLIWTLSEPYGARTWWPCKDLNVDKADSVDLHVTVPTGLTVATNGLYHHTSLAPGGGTTHHWQSRYPIATYLVSLAVHNYAVFTDWYVSADGDSLPIVNYVVPAYEQEARNGYAATADMIAAFTEGFGPYPFPEEKYGHAHFPWGGGMEHQTCSSMIYWYYGQGLVAHELAHQWWGDLVTCKDFHHIWLNEGFATWSEAYWREQDEGPAAYRQEMLAAEYLGGGTIYVENADSFWEIFDTDLTYNKASWVVHMLRGVLGDEDFFAALALYRERFAYGVAETADLQAVMEEVSGRDLEAFFQQWIYGAYYPRYKFGWVMTPQGDQTLVQLRIEQVQDQAGVFVMPLQVKIITDLGDVWITVENERRVQNYSVVVAGTAYVAELDPERWVLRQVLGGGATAAPAAPPPPTLTAYPNPFNPRTTLRLELPAAGVATVAIHDAAGRLVRTLLAEGAAAGTRELVWDGRDDAGRAVAAGAYFAVARTEAGRATARLTLVK